MKKLLSYSLWILLLLIGAGIYLYSQRYQIASKNLVKGMESLTGGGVELKELHFAMDGSITLEHMTLQNPAGYQQKTLAELSNIVMSFDLKAYLLGQGVHFKRIAANIDQINLERTEKGGLNLRDLPALSEAALQKKETASKFLIDELELQFGKIQFDEYVAGQEKQNSEVDLAARKETYGRLTDPSVLIQAPALRVLSALNRGSLGIRRELIQAKLMDTSKALAVSVQVPVSEVPAKLETVSKEIPQTSSSEEPLASSVDATAEQTPNDSPDASSESSILPAALKAATEVSSEQVPAAADSSNTTPDTKQ